MTSAATLKRLNAVSQPHRDTQAVKRTVARAAHPPTVKDHPRVPKKVQRLDEYASLVLQIEALEARRTQLKEIIANENPNGVAHGKEYDLIITDGVAVWKDNVFKAKIDELVLNGTTPKFRSQHSGTTPYKKISVKART